MVTQGNHKIETFPIIYPDGFKAYKCKVGSVRRVPKCTNCRVTGQTAARPLAKEFLELAPWQSLSGGVCPNQARTCSYVFYSLANLYYSFNVAGTHIIVLGSYADVSSYQYKWLKTTLAKVNRRETLWLVVLLHASWYNSNVAHKGKGESMRKAMEEMMYKARVVYVTIGDGGNREWLALMFEQPSSSISLYQEPSFGHGRLRILNNTHAHWSCHRNNESDSVMADEVWLQSLSSSKACKQEVAQGQGSSSSLSSFTDEL
ncbi:Purple acid phosphatase [Actinidia chinensis var. chinensis]|uniref:Purple acid phosphatase n=1 Tax=Actinidia chinensis var. chinensis TaxID=1590841 RepID=A0A2R6QW12_ACTCC|nr:Purple acid phosphatase [Actinidia chinensis var. chinensis]